MGEVEGVPGCRGILRATGRQASRVEVAEARVRARRPHALLPTGRRLKTVGERKRWAGPRWAGPVGPPGKWTR